MVRRRRTSRATAKQRATWRHIHKNAMNLAKDIRKFINQAASW